MRGLVPLSVLAKATCSLISGVESVYSVEDAVEALASYRGYMIEVSVAQGDHDDDPDREHFTAFSGVVDRVDHCPVSASTGRKPALESRGDRI
jgi:hypothetical protein